MDNLVIALMLKPLAFFLMTTGAAWLTRKLLPRRWAEFLLQDLSALMRSRDERPR